MELWMSWGMELLSWSNSAYTQCWKYHLFCLLCGRDHQIDNNYILDRYDKNTGEFTAPSDGSYYFSVSGIANSGKRAFFAIRSNKSNYCNSMAFDLIKPNVNAGHESAGCSVVLPLKAGDKVQCFNDGDDDGAIFSAYCSGFQI